MKISQIKSIPRPALVIIIILIAYNLFTGDDVPENFGNMEEAVVERVVDGDTIVIFGGERVRMIGINTPESVKEAGEIEHYGIEASNFTKNKLEGKTVYLEKDVSNRDGYDRLLRYIYLEDGTFYNELIVKEGYAFAGTYPPDVKYNEILHEAEIYARENNLGLWGESN
ncbi:MAG: thermonuclease family protein [Bacillota bacterium]|nr:thermonuclease family protein [Bacillota bacterium]